MPASKNSAAQRRSSSPSGWGALALVTAALGLLSAAVVYYVQSREHALYWGDAAAHLNIARRLVDGRTLGYEQIGTVWLPLPHWIMSLFVGDDPLWRTGLAGAIPAALCWVFASACWYCALRRLVSPSASAIGLALFALNPNLLYLQSIPMTESLFFAGWLGAIAALLRFSASPSSLWAAVAGLGVLVTTLTRYEGWFLIPFVALYILIQGGWRSSLIFALVAGSGPLYWLAHNWIFYSDPLEFYRGQGSAKDIQGAAPYPGRDDWRQSLVQFYFASKAVLGAPLLALGTIGILFSLRRASLWVAFLLLLSPAFYVMSLHSGGTPIYVPEIYPFSHYNTRYALAGLPLLCLLAAALADRMGRAGWLLVPVAMAWWIATPVMTWQESEVNSISRRAWTQEVADLLKQHYAPHTGILMPFGDLTAILTEAGIPLRDCIHQGDKLEFDRATQRPDLFLDTAWVIAMEGDPASLAMQKAVAAKLPYQRVKLLAYKYSRPVEVWRRSAP